MKRKDNIKVEIFHTFAQSQYKWCEWHEKKIYDRRYKYFELLLFFADIYI